VDGVVVLPSAVIINVIQYFRKILTPNSVHFIISTLKALLALSISDANTKQLVQHGVRV
jgi:hypothetical protein